MNFRQVKHITFVGYSPCANYINILFLIPGVLRFMLQKLTDEEIISSEGINKWRNSDEEPEGKGIYL